MSVAPEPILEARDLFKRFGRLEAVRGVSLAIREGVCFGLLGPNGAGKTTTIEIIEGIHAASSGSILYRGRPVDRSFHERIGIQFQATALPEHLRVIEVLRLFHGFYRKTASIDSVVEACRLGEFLEQDSHRLSGGQKQRLLLALGLINDPELLFLDEPTTGLDPQARRGFWDLVRGIKRRGKTIVLTTHYMEEASELCDEIAVMDHGRIIAQGAPQALLRARYPGLTVQLRRDEIRFPWHELPGRVLEHGSGWLEIRTEQVDEVFRKLVDGGVPLSSLRVRQPDLEDLFLDLTGRGLRE